MQLIYKTYSLEPLTGFKLVALPRNIIVRDLLTLTRVHARELSGAAKAIAILFTISSSSIDSPMTYARLAYSLPYT